MQRHSGKMLVLHCNVLIAQAEARLNGGCKLGYGGAGVAEGVAGLTVPHICMDARYHKTFYKFGIFLGCFDNCYLETP